MVNRLGSIGTPVKSTAVNARTVGDGVPGTRWAGPCAGRCTKAAYNAQVELARRFLDGDADVPLTILRNPSTQSEHVMTVNGVRARFPAYRVDEHLVWGMTERIVRQLLSLLD